MNARLPTTIALALLPMAPPQSAVEDRFLEADLDYNARKAAGLSLAELRLQVMAQQDLISTFGGVL